MANIAARIKFGKLLRGRPDSLSREFVTILSSAKSPHPAIRLQRSTALSPTLTMLAALLAILTGMVSYLLTARVRTYAVQHAILDPPNQRSSHSVPTPRGGGIAILCASLLAIAGGAAFHIVAPVHALALVPGMILLGVVGWLDDHGGLSARIRLAAHFIAASAGIAVLHGLPDLQLGTSSVHLGLGGSVAAVIGVVWSINLFNFMDGIDGLAGSQATIIFAIAGLLFHVRGVDSLALISCGFAAASAGFLCWNWPPAKIFMGDVSSGALGFMIAVLAVAGERSGSVPLVAFGILGGVFASDATVTLVRRLYRGALPADAHRDHAYQRISRVWGAHLPVTLAAASLTFLLGALAAIAALRQELAGMVILLASAVLLATGVAAERRAPM